MIGIKDGYDSDQTLPIIYKYVTHEHKKQNSWKGDETTPILIRVQTIWNFENIHFKFWMFP